jgi:hypothetical protein
VLREKPPWVVAGVVVVVDLLGVGFDAHGDVEGTPPMAAVTAFHGVAGMLSLTASFVAVVPSVACTAGPCWKSWRETPGGLQVFAGEFCFEFPVAWNSCFSFPHPGCECGCTPPP